MPPTNPWGKKPQPQTQQRNTPSSGYPELNVTKLKENAPQSQYEEVQEDELIVLASVYGDDFRRIETNNSAWKVGSTFIQLFERIQSCLQGYAPGLKKARHGHIRFPIQFQLSNSTDLNPEI